MAGLRSPRRNQSEERYILIVEDERVVGDTLAQILAAEGYRVRVAITAEEALNTIAFLAPDLAIIDVMLPRMNGLEFAIHLKHTCPCCHVLLISGEPSAEELLQQARRQGNEFEILAKPVHPTVILEKMATLLCPEACRHFGAA